MLHRPAHRPDGRASADHPLSMLGSSTGSPLFPHPRPFPTGIELFHQGDPPDEVFCIEQGLVKLLYGSADGRECIVGVRSDGKFLGVSAALIATPQPVTAIPLVPSWLVRLDAADFLRRVREDLGFSWRVHEHSSRELQGQTTHLAESMTLPATELLFKLLWRFAPQPHGAIPEGGFPVELPVRKLDVAQMLGITPQALSGLIRKLICQNMLRRQGGKLFILHSLDQDSAF